MRYAKAIVLIQLAAFWPVLQWYRLRMSDGSDEPWGLLALATAALFVVKRADWHREGSSLVPILFTVAYIACYPFLPPIGRAALAVFALLSVMTPLYCGRGFHSGLWTLGILSLPIIPSVQFCFGYPLRVLTAACVSFFLRVGGLPVDREGAMLEFFGKLIWVDAPCSGIRMMWMGSYFTAVLICAFGIRGVYAAGLAAIASVTMFFGNVVRSLLLFFLEAFSPGYPGALHGGIGVLAFLSMAVVVFLAARGIGMGLLRFARNDRKCHCERSEAIPYRHTLTTLTILAGFIPFVTPTPSIAAIDPASVVWPSNFRGLPLVELPLTHQETTFAKEFPGAVKRFRAGGKELIVRYVTQATRKLHPATDCLKAVGYNITPANAEVDAKEQWSCAFAENGPERLKVCEIIRGENARTWPDTQSWYWSALWESAQGPFWAYTVAEPLLE